MKTENSERRSSSPFEANKEVLETELTMLVARSYGNPKKYRDQYLSSIARLEPMLHISPQLLLASGAAAIGDSVPNPFLFELIMKEFAPSYYSGNTLDIDLIVKYGFACPTESALNKLVSLSPIVEIGAGSGYWAACLSEKGARVVAIDSNPRDSWFGVKKGKAIDAGNYPNHTLLLCAPSQHPNSAGFDALNSYAQEGGDKLVLVWHPDYPRNNGCDRFHALREREWDLTDRLELPMVLASTRIRRCVMDIYQRRRKINLVKSQF